MNPQEAKVSNRSYHQEQQLRQPPTINKKQVGILQVFSLISLTQLFNNLSQILQISFITLT